MVAMESAAGVLAFTGAPVPDVRFSHSDARACNTSGRSTTGRPTPRRSRARTMSRASDPSSSQPETGDSAAPPQNDKSEWRLVEKNKDLLVWGAGLTVSPFLVKYLLTATGVSDATAGILVAFVMVSLLIGWTATYFFRVATKDMTYAKQLRQYENQVLQKRYEELSEEEAAALADELEKDSR